MSSFVQPGMIRVDSTISRSAGDHLVVGHVEAGRIRHHLRHIVEDPDNAVVIVSYQAEGTLGRQLAEGVERIQIMDQWHALNAAVYVLDGFSGHADRNDLAWWYEQTGGQIERGFLVHGEPEGLEALAPEASAPRPESGRDSPIDSATYEV